MIKKLAREIEVNPKKKEEAGEVEDLQKDLMRRSAQLDQMQEVAFYVEELSLRPTSGSSAQIREISASHPWKRGL